MTQLNPQNFFATVAGTGGGASAKLSDINDWVVGEIVDQAMLPATDFSTKKPKHDSRTGEPVEQLAVTLQTELRNWQGVSRIPLVEKDNPASGQKPASEDDGRRNVYIEPWTNIHSAVSDAVLDETGERGPLLNGGTLGVQVFNLKDTGKGNPLKEHRAKYTAPAPSAAAPADFFGGGAQPQQAQPAAQPEPQSVAAQAAVADRQPPQGASANPWENQAAAQQAATPAAPPTQDPWGAPVAGGPNGGAPF